MIIKCTNKQHFDVCLLVLAHTEVVNICVWINYKFTLPFFSNGKVFDDEMFIKCNKSVTRDEEMPKKEEVFCIYRYCL